MAGPAVVLEAGKIADEEPVVAARSVDHLDRHRLARLAGEAVDLVDAQRVALLGHEEALAIRIVGEPLEALVAVTADTKRELLAVGGIQALRALGEADLEQALLALVADHVGIAADVLDGFWIAEAVQGDAAQYRPGEREFDQFRVLVGDGKQRPPVGVEGQRRNVVAEALDDTAFDRDAVVGEPQGAFLPLGSVVPLLQCEQHPLAEHARCCRYDAGADGDDKDGGKCGPPR